jgi:hypothetical protein
MWALNLELSADAWCHTNSNTNSSMIWIISGWYIRNWDVVRALKWQVRFSRWPPGGHKIGQIAKIKKLWAIRTPSFIEIALAVTKRALLTDDKLVVTLRCILVNYSAGRCRATCFLSVWLLPGKGGNWFCPCLPTTTTTISVVSWLQNFKYG